MATIPEGLPVPDFFDDRNAADWAYRPDPELLLEKSSAWRTTHGVASSGRDRSRVHLLLIDEQKDFCFPEGSLYVGGRSGTGAIDDSARISRFIYRNLGWISEITCTMDTHYPHQIFFASFWHNAAGEPLAPHREITTEDIRSGAVSPSPLIADWLCEGDMSWLQRQVEFYCEELEKAGKYRLYLWPPHCLLGSEGHALVGVIQEARLFHAYVRGAENAIEAKGGNPLTENYSVLSPEVLRGHDGADIATRNTALTQTLIDSDAIVIAGQAASHCVKSTIEDLLTEVQAQKPELLQQIYILRDCMSSVAVPDGDGGFIFDFTPQAEEALERFAHAGMHVVETTVPVASWSSA